MTDTRSTLLLVDDTPTNIDILIGIFKEDYQIKVAKSGEMALKIMQLPDKPDLVLLDIMMPGMDGYEVCRRLKADHSTRHVPIIFVTAKITSEDELKGFELGAVDYVVKPISPAVVQARVKTHLALYDQNRELYLKVREKTAQISSTRMKIIQQLGRAAEYKDNETGIHVIRMSHYSRILGLAAGMAENEADLLLAAAPMHDIGKIGIPDHILKKPGKLDEHELSVMQTHAAIGGEILGDDDSELLQAARIVADSHHEKWDGNGYPNGLKGEDIPFIGRVVAIADVFDALTSERPYKKAWSVEDAIALIEQEAGSHFDPRLVKLFVANLEKILEVKQSFDE